jgi:predicted hydrolase (HD superfamily)
MPITREQAWEKLCEWTKTDSLRKHARAVEVVMREAARRYGPGDAAIEQWGIAGMLHDADYEQWPEEHPGRIVAWLRHQGEEEIAYAVSAHYTTWGITPKSPLDRSLLACDELTGFVIACCLVRPEGVRTLTPKSVRKKLKDKAFAAKVDRREVSSGIEILGVDPSEHIQFIVEALRPHAEELGIGGKGGSG